jgi:hypothetical protein
MVEESSQPVTSNIANTFPLKGWQKTAYFSIISTGGALAVAAGVAMAVELKGAPNISPVLFTAFCLVLGSWAAFFIAGLWFLLLVSLVNKDGASRRHRLSAARHVGYQIAVFLILALSLRAFGLHDEEPAHESSVVSATQATTSTSTQATTSTSSSGSSSSTGSGDKVLKTSSRADEERGLRTHSKGDTRRVILTASELAAIMILFTLAELAALLGKDVARATEVIEGVGQEAETARKQMEEARKSLDQSKAVIEKSEEAIQKAIKELKDLEVPTAVQELHSDVKKNVLTLLKAWSGRTTTDDPLLALAWTVFLQEYVKEEASDFLPAYPKTEGVPLAAQPYPTVKDKKSGDDMVAVQGKSIAYVATNVGFYAKFLKSLVATMRIRLENKFLSIAVLTTVLPAYWWNWPRSTGRWLAYSPIEDLRKTMELMPDRVRSDRLILVREDAEDSRQKEEAVENALDDEGLLTQMKGWWVANAVTGDDWLTCSESPDSSMVELAKKMPPRVGESLTQTEGRIHPLFTEEPAEPLVMDEREWKASRLMDQFMRLHKGGGGCWALPVGDDFIVEKMEGRYDFTFIGVSPKLPSGPIGAWSVDEDPSMEWKFCIMTSASDKNETMFMTLIEGDAARLQMQKVRENLKSVLSKRKSLIDPNPAETTSARA